ncbi:MAG: aminotransferase class V-fold PLP-dependent enzyme [Desulfobacterales bacterium]|nr:MAG: aminotransferase class V-fold PLP-dependent enzyme [Desulfobacterales bacterium]
MDFKAIQQEFPIREKMVYLNNASIGPLSTRVIAAVNEFMIDVRDNGRTNYPNWCTIADNTIKDNIAKLIGADKTEIAFVKNTTEGILLVANGIEWQVGDNVIIADIEYPSNVYCWMNLARRGVNIKWLETKCGRIVIDDVTNLIDSRTRLVSFSAVQFSNGFRLDIEQLSELCQKKGILLNLDGIQYLGALDIDVSIYPIDFLSAGGHKFLLGPIGTGVFYCRKESMQYLHPHNVGYHSVDKPEDHLDYDLTFRPTAARFEEALVNFPGIWGLGAAVSIFLDLGMKNVEKHLLRLTSLAIEGLESKGYEIISSKKENERSALVSFSHCRFSVEKITDRLQKANINVAIRGKGIRVSPSIYNDDDDIEALLQALP